MKHPTLHLNEHYQQNVKRLMLWYNLSAEQHLGRTTHQHEHIHEARLCFKRIRSVLRLARPGMNKKTFNQWNRFYRDQARALSDLRDATAIIELLDDQIQKHKSASIIEVLTQLKKHATKHRRVLFEGSKVKEVKHQIIHNLHQQEVVIHNWHAESDAKKVFYNGLQGVYEEGKMHFESVLVQADDLLLHEWRKSVKHLWYLLWKLRVVWPGILDAYATESQQLSRTLGYHHDIVVLEAYIKNLASDTLSEHGLIQLNTQLSTEKTRLEKQALEQGLRLYSHKKMLNKKIFRVFEG